MSTTLRLVELSANTDAVERLQQAVGDISCIEQWLLHGNDNRSTLRLLLPSDAVEAVFDAIAEHELPDDSFRVMLFPIEATLPAVGQPEEEQTSKEAAKQSGDQRQRGRISRDELLNDLTPGTQISTIYLIMVLLSAIVASVGLLRDNVAVIIGAMVIAPLLMPNMALALATALGDLKMAARALATNAAGVAVAFIFSCIVGLVHGVDPSADELQTRTRVSLGDIGLGLASGIAGAISVTTGVPATLIGVMVAVALLPPLVATGLLLGAGEWVMAGGAALLLAVNIICINLAGVGTFVLQGIRPRTWYEASVARRATFTALALWLTALLSLAVLVWIAEGSD
ncbi:TIGR00341 family protein [Phycisphaerales bacterium AB-hyl4]|uniref:TIGR00341 family protein n=1 Tax=Natronomicrosphaera hydrolytica TaxID=3242702 RepID=A0ABV4UB04_9BACT